MKRCAVRIVLYTSVLGMVALLGLATSTFADFRGAYGPENWSSTALTSQLNVGISPATGPSPFIAFSYEALWPTPYSYHFRKACFSTVATKTGTIAFDWEYDFCHSYWEKYADFWVYADGPSGVTEQHLVDFYIHDDWRFCRTFTGSASLDVTEGYEFGLIVRGKHYDYARKLYGTVTTTNFGFPVLIDIKPGGYPNSFNANGNGVIPIAILASADLDVADVDPSSLSFDGAAVRVKGNGDLQCSFDDVSGPEGTPDGYLDLVCQFVDDFTEGWVLGDGTATVTGNLFDGTPIVGSDSISIVP